uniref:Envelope protein n=1 Tax=Panagrolaimus sp. ES5 TaxID=591445 RepID=A0AC34GUT3_9BILA
MLPYELQDVFDFEDGAVIVRGYVPPHFDIIPYVIGRNEPIKLQICREKYEKCKYNFGEVKQIQFCYSHNNSRSQYGNLFPCGRKLYGFVIREDFKARLQNQPYCMTNFGKFASNMFPNIPLGGCIDAEIQKQLNGFFPIYNYVDTYVPTPPPPTTVPPSTSTSSLPSTFTSFLSTTKQQTTKIFATSPEKAVLVAESFTLQWILIGIGALIIVILITASIYCCVRHKFTKPHQKLKKSSTEKQIILEAPTLPPSSEGAPGTQQSSEACLKPTIIDFRKKHEMQNRNKTFVAKKESNIKSLQTAVLPPQGLRALKNADELYRLALTAESRDERNVYLDSAIENANEEIEIWKNSTLSQSNDTSSLPIIAKRIIKAKKAGVKLISTKDPTKLIPEQMDGLTYEQINDLALIEHYPNVRYALFERAAELIKRAFEDSAPDAHFDKETIEPLLYQYQLAIYEVNEEPHKEVEQRNKLLDEILKKKELKENDK